jgi:hypothetical protein
MKTHISQATAGRRLELLGDALHDGVLHCRHACHFVRTVSAKMRHRDCDMFVVQAWALNKHIRQLGARLKPEVVIVRYACAACTLWAWL